jgi:hypothetical protein
MYPLGGGEGRGWRSGGAEDDDLLIVLAETTKREVKLGWHLLGES